MIPRNSSADPIVIPVPGSKSLTIRALAAAALAEGESTLSRGLDSDDTRAAIGALRSVGAGIDNSSDTWTVDGVGGRPREAQSPIDLGESGLTARIMIAISALIDGKTVLVGQGRLPSRPMSGIIDAVTQLGAAVLSDRDEFPIVVEGRGQIRGGEVVVDASQSTQFATGVSLIAPFASDPLTIRLEALRGSAGYLEMTLQVLRIFGGQVENTRRGFTVENGGLRGATILIEPDASAAVYPMVAAAITGRRITVPDLPADSLQPDLAVAGFLEEMGCTVDMHATSTTVQGPGDRLEPLDADLSDSPDGALALAVACLVASGTSRLHGLHSLRYKESDRLAALAAEITRIGGEAEIDGDQLIITPREIVPTTIRTYGDHRMAMSFGLLRLIARDIDIENPAVVSKTWPGYWGMLDRLDN